MSDKDQAKINSKEVEKKVEELIKKISPARAIELTQKLALKTAISGLIHLPSEKIMGYLNLLHEHNVEFATHVLEGLDALKLETPLQRNAALMSNIGDSNE